MKFLILMGVLILICCSLCGSVHTADESYPRVTTSLGTVEGFYGNSSKGLEYEAYLGIPYAVPTTGNQRFEIARHIESWNDKILSAKAFGSMCTQIDPSILSTGIPVVIGSEDCLYLNVYAPSQSRRNLTGTSADLLPVIFFIPSGTFQIGGAARYGPEYLLNENVVLVTINYRVGPLGFLSIEDSTVPGNRGLKGQAIAMCWIKDNILYFGGDLDAVTLVGQSAGAASVHYHYLTNITKGLFQRGLSVSGTMLDCWPQTEDSLDKAEQLADIVGCITSNVSAMVDCLKIKSADEITLASTQFLYWLDNAFVMFGPVVEKGCNDFTLIDRLPIESITTGRMQNLPWIMTAVSREGLISGLQFISNATLIEKLNDNWIDIAPHLLDFNYTVPESNKSEIAQLIRQHYLGTSSIDNSTVEQVVTMIGDRLFGYDTVKATMLQAAAVESPVRFGYFSYRRAHSFSELFTGITTDYGVSHVDDILYVLKSYFDTTTTEEDLQMQKVMIDFWVSYARDGIPDVGVKWQCLDPNGHELSYLHIAKPDNISMEVNSNFGESCFWDSIDFYENSICV